MGNKIIGKAYIPGIGSCYVEDGDSPAYVIVRSVKTGFSYSRARDLVNWRKTKRRSNA